ncbi:hypothetical protein GCM10008985_32160 [Halococcus dombrowskii]
MYIAVFVVIAGLVIANVFLPILSSPSSSQPAETGADSVATSTPTNPANRGQSTQSPSQDSLPTPSAEGLAQAESKATPTNTEFEKGFKQYINKNTNITIVSINTQGNVVYIEWVPNDMTTRAITEDIGYIAGAYDGLVSNGWGVKKLQGTVLNMDRQSQGTFQVKTQWVKQRQRGDISNKEVINRTMQTINSTPSVRSTTASN